MSYRIIKTVKGRQYIYEQTSKRVGKRVVTMSRYIAPLVPVNRTGKREKVITTHLSRSDVAKAVASRSFQNFITKGEGGFYPVAVLPPSIKQVWGSLQSRTLLVSSDTKDKITSKHPEVTVAMYGLVQEIIDNGVAYDDRHDQLVIFHQVAGRYWKISIKCTVKGEALISTFHRVLEKHAQKAERALTRRAL